MEFPKNNILDNWLEANKNTEIDRFIERNLAITEKVCAVLKERGIKKKQFAEMLGKKPSEISKWLSGLHNLTLKSITKMEEVLDINLINIEPIKEIEYVYLGSIPGGMEDAINDYEETNYSEAS
ncbi:helix-turn-helix transcriptional regulator [Xanthomarina sp. F1114]|uniref:helix-turn-helix domain-containing protein n=1 Tax=Xanthomarina sp. F1114 TaxID=2996019 RepID=UPI00225DEF7B|nr:helix-turn-helix transcriptional regulator [Xanthomarina sp. F1114]MCX7548343.1 helix-turn-helix transcriptional regulator [Xanthomarina sp. F1114]